MKKNKITVELTHSLDHQTYDLPLTLKTYLSSDWKNVVVKQNGKEQNIAAEKDAAGNFVLYKAVPNEGAITILKK